MSSFLVLYSLSTGRKTTMFKPFRLALRTLAMKTSSPEIDPSSTHPAFTYIPRTYSSQEKMDAHPGEGNDAIYPHTVVNMLAEDCHAEVAKHVISDVVTPHNQTAVDDVITWLGKATLRLHHHRQGRGLFSLNLSNSPATQFPYECFVELPSPRFGLTKVQVQCSGRVLCFLQVLGEDHTAMNYQLTPGYTYGWSPELLTVYSPDDLVIKIRQEFPVAALAVTISWTALKAFTPNWNAVYTSPSSGFIQSPFYGGYGEGHTLSGWQVNEVTVTVVSVPPGHGLMVSLHDLDRCQEKITAIGPLRRTKHQCTISHFDLRSGQEKNIACHDMQTSLVHAANLTLERAGCTSLYRIKTFVRGFKLRFSFHDPAGLPEALEDGTWNCSVPHWPKFQEHLLCNFVLECREGEDEAMCPYSTDRCLPGWVFLGQDCYLFVKPHYPMAWLEAEERCLKRNATLAMLKTPEEVQAVRRTFQSLLYTYVDLFVGVRSARARLHPMYQNSWQYVDGMMAYFGPFYITPYHLTGCGLLRFDPDGYVDSTCTQVSRAPRYLCQTSALAPTPTPTPSPTHTGSSSPLLLPPLPPPPLLVYPPPAYSNSSSESRDRSSSPPEEAAALLVKCRDGHLTRTFLACDSQSHCWAREGYGGLDGGRDIDSGEEDVMRARCGGAALEPLPPAFPCQDGYGAVPYTLVCDRRSDCGDHSDEIFCVFPPCHRQTELQCHDGRVCKCVAFIRKCDGYSDCPSNEDETDCKKRAPDRYIDWRHNPPALLDLDDGGRLTVTSLPSQGLGDDRVRCPNSHLQCPSHNFCIPVYLRCNGVWDCPGHEDEQGCDGYACPGWYRCRASRVCALPQQVCDGREQCPQGDDEAACAVRCPPGCRCYGQAYFCTRPFPAAEHPQLRYLQARGSGVQPPSLAQNLLLLHLGLAACGLTSLGELPPLPNLHSLDLRDNALQEVCVDDLVPFPSLRRLRLAGNPMLQAALEPCGGGSTGSLPALEVLDLSRIPLNVLNASAIADIMPNLKALNLSQSGVQHVLEPGLAPLSRLRVLDVRQCSLVTFPAALLLRLDYLSFVYADNYRLCCREMLPAGFNPRNCRAPLDHVSSCESLLSSNVYRVFLALAALLALLGNSASLVARSLFAVKRKKKTTGHEVLVASLSVSDLLMGVYLAVIGVADRVYEGSYLWQDRAWKNSRGCSAAGLLCLLSSEVSTMTVLLITLDRFLVLAFPFRRLRFGRDAALCAGAAVWALGLVVAAFPLLPPAAHWLFYGQTGICTPLPITRSLHTAAESYAFAVMIVVNLVLFVLIAAGQAVVYNAIDCSPKLCLEGGRAASSSSRYANDSAVARRLVAVAAADFLCWFPIVVLGLLSARGVSVPGEVNVALAIFALPLNAVINPFMYTLGAALERSRQVREARLRKFLLATAVKPCR